MRDSGNQVSMGWTSWLAKLSMGVLLFESTTGLAITLMPFHGVVQWGVLLHTFVGVLTLLPMSCYYVAHWRDTRHHALTPVMLLGYIGVAGLFVCSLSGLVVTWQGLLENRTSWLWRQVHLITTLVVLGTVFPHILLILVRLWGREEGRAARRYLWHTICALFISTAIAGGLLLIDSGVHYVNEFPEDYHYLYGEERPFAPSLAQTDTGRAFDARSLSGSESCGTEECHSQILEEWKPSAHRYAAMDTIFQGIQIVMAEQNGPESTRYCGGCHDPISLFSGTKNIFVENLTDLQGYHEGVSCLACHAIRETDVQGNANYTVTQPRQYLWQWGGEGIQRLGRDFLIRVYPKEHGKLSKRMFKAPEYCAACHKQFIDKEVNRVGWVQLQNQYDNWAASHWNQEGDPTKTIECRECHMPLVESTDPAAGDPTDYNRHANDKKHRSHRFIASNQLMPKLLRLEGWEEQVQLTEQWLQGNYEIPEIQDKWAEGSIVQLALDTPPKIVMGEKFPVRIIFTSSKVGHDFPTGPLDIIQSWVELQAADCQGNVFFTSGIRDERHFIEPGSFLFKAEPVDQYGNLIDRHNLWEMVGVRYRRSLFPGYSDTVEYMIDCPANVALPSQRDEPDGTREFMLHAPKQLGTVDVTAMLLYRKVDQFLLNYLFGEDTDITAPVVEIARATATIQVEKQ